VFELLLSTPKPILIFYDHIMPEKHGKMQRLSSLHCLRNSGFFLLILLEKQEAAGRSGMHILSAAYVF
jgi:hypothetical protein